jgi:SAM-dependent methyltransferase
VAATLADDELMGRFRNRRQLPSGYGFGFDERVVEFPWLLAQELRPPILDAGSTLNHRYVLERLGKLAQELTIVTLAPEPESSPDLGVTYIYDDLRALPFPSASFRTIACLSTLEHVGMDNARFGAAERRSENPLAERDRAVRELCRVAAPGARLLVTVPYGVPQDTGWQLQFAREDVGRLVELLGPSTTAVEVFRYSEDGWRRSTLEQGATARYEDHSVSPHRAQDRAAAARAVACVRAELPG